MGTTEDGKHNGHGHSARPGQACKPSEIRHDGRPAASSLAAAVFPRSAGRVFPRSPPFLASCGGCGLPLPRCAGSRFPSPAVFGLAGAGAAVCRSLARCGFPSLAVRRRPAARGGVFFAPSARCPCPPGLAGQIASAWRRPPCGLSVPP